MEQSTAYSHIQNWPMTVQSTSPAIKHAAALPSLLDGRDERQNDPIQLLICEFGYIHIPEETPVLHRFYSLSKAEVLSNPSSMHQQTGRTGESGETRRIRWAPSSWPRGSLRTWLSCRIAVAAEVEALGAVPGESGCTMAVESMAGEIPAGRLAISAAN